MRIDHVGIFRVSMPLKDFYKTSFAKAYSFDGVLVNLRSGDLSGWGESTPWSEPAYCGECAATEFIVCRDFIAPRLIGKDIGSGDTLQDLLSGIKENQFAKAAFDLAWWDLRARELKLPLWKVLKGKSPVVDGGAAFSAVEDIDKLLRLIGDAVAKGYKRVKLKYCPGWELDVIREVRKNFPDTVIHIDCNSAYRLSDLAMFKELDRYNLAMIEQPLAHDDLLDHAKLQREIKTPVCLDESVTSLEKAAKAIELKSCRWINIKLGRVGGITNAVKIHDFCAGAGMPCWVGAMGESSVGYSHNIAIATLPNMKYPSDILPSNRFYEHDLAFPPVEHSGPSQFTARDVPGIGVVPLPEQLEKMTIEKAIL